MRKAVASCGLLAGLVVIAEPLQGGPAVVPPECASLMAAELRSKAAARCVYTAAGKESDRGPAAALLEELAAARPDLPWFSFYLGSLHWKRGSVTTAEDLFARAAEGLHRAGDEDGEVFARVNRSQLLALSGKWLEAGAEVDRIAAIAEASQDSEHALWGQIARARYLLDRGEDLARAYELLRGMEIPPSMEGAPELTKERLARLGNACLAIGRLREAQESFRRLAELAAASQDPYREADARYGLALIAFERLRETPTEALRAETVRLAREALDAGAGARHAAVEAFAALTLGVLTPDEEGLRYLDRCHRIARRAWEQSHCLNFLALRVAATEPDEARRLIERSKQLAEQSGDPWAEVRVWEHAMQVDWVIEDPERAIEASWEALDVIERLRDRQLAGSEAQAGFFSVWSDDYARFAGELLKEADAGLERDRAIGEAFRVNERMRGRALTNWLRRASLQAGSTPGLDVPTMNAVRSSLRLDEALLSYQIAPWEDLAGDFGGGSWLLAVTRDRVSKHRLPGRVEVRQKLRIFEGLIERRDGMETDQAVQLFQELVAPALAELPPQIDRLILVPDDALHRLPFAALRASAEAEPLGARYELVQVPSATLWLDWRRERAEAPGRPILVLADPDLPAAGPAASPGESAGAPVETEIAQARDASGPLGRLPHARREGRTAVRALGDGLLLTDAEASEATLRGLPLRDFGLVHFAAHAVTDEDRPERSAVLLAPGGGADGLLQSAEIAGLDLAGRTVVLASCRSASGSVLRGEGVMSLGRAFFQAGAHGVVASLWPLRDDESAALFDRFYRRLGEGATIGEALRNARREAIDAGEPAAAWAGLVVFGDGSLAPVPGGRSSGLPAGAWWVTVFLIVLALAIAIGALLRRSWARRF